MFIASKSVKGTRIQTQPHETREAAAEEFFRLYPKQKSCSSSVAIDRGGKLVESHTNIYFHDRAYS